tara:strand:+ start:866 stop:1081 length:216 start_codon:yes stop_codon:yes gene_type:complete
MSTTNQSYSEQTSPTTTFTDQTATTLTFSEETSSTGTFTEQSPTKEGTLFGAGDYNTEFYEARTLIMGRVE